MITETKWKIDNRIKLDGENSIFCIGDVHGDFSKFREITDFVDSNYPSFKISLGDVIDRGNDSIGCLKIALEEYDVFLPGNHETLLIGTIYNHPEFPAVFMANGGDWVLDLTKNPKYMHLHLVDILIDQLGKDNFDKFLQYGGLIPRKICDPVIHYENGSLLFVHAGILPNKDTINWIKSIDVWNEYLINPLWIREGFLDWKGSYGKNSKGNDWIVVHGHSYEHFVKDHLPNEKYKNGKWPVGYTDIDGYRIGLDTGGTVSGIITGCIFQENRYKIIQVR